ncbi:MAG TPA: cupin domain-containing protein [Burkholderiales bacterium]|nr:cupin domain-containing protein [Burkholderiales bacterium]
MKLLGGLTPDAFLRGYWQKRPLLVRAAVKDFAGLADAPQLLRFAARGDVESRMVERHGRQWETAHGPFPRARLKQRDATLLVSGINLLLPAADALLRRFAFIPQARLDDVMVSCATPGGGVGPHVDSYDVFLLQGPGRRRWTWWFAGKKHAATLQCGDMLYLPPGVKHDGVALDACSTCSIGFRTPRGRELAAAFLDWLHERGLPDAVYRDPRLRPAARPARIPREMLAFARRHLARIRWSARDAEDFLGAFLTEPKAHVVFHPGKRARLARGSRVTLAPSTQLLYSGARFYLNGEALTVPAAARPALRGLADKRSLDGSVPAALRPLLDRWQRLGYLRVT